MASHGFFGLTSLLVFCCFVAADETQTVYRNVSGDKIEGILKSLDISYKELAGKKDNIFTYDFERKGVKVRLYNYGGEDLWIESDYNDKLTLDDINRWNMQSKFSRAVLVKEGTGSTTSLEAQIDCTLGVTDGMMRQFILRFDGELQAFAQFLKKRD